VAYFAPGGAIAIVVERAASGKAAAAKELKMLSAAAERLGALGATAAAVDAMRWSGHGYADDGSMVFRFAAPAAGSAGTAVAPFTAFARDMGESAVQLSALVEGGSGGGGGGGYSVAAATHFGALLTHPASAAGSRPPDVLAVPADSEHGFRVIFVGDDAHPLVRARTCRCSCLPPRRAAASALLVAAVRARQRH